MTIISLRIVKTSNSKPESAIGVNFIMKGYDDTKSINENFRIFFKFAKKSQNNGDPYLHWNEHYQSINNKRLAVHLLQKEIIDQIPNWIRENEEIDTIGFSSGLHSTILLIKYQSFLNAIYAICENLAYLGSKYVPGLKRGYHDQIKKISDLKEQSSEYAKILEKNVWYSQVNIMRSEATHFFDGFVYINHSKRPAILFRRMIHRRDGVGPETEIDIPDIETHVNELTTGVDNYLKNLCVFLFTFIEDDFEMEDMCVMQIPNESGIRIFGPKVMTYLEYCNGGSWRCEAFFPCFLKENCPFIGVIPPPLLGNNGILLLQEDGTVIITPP